MLNRLLIAFCLIGCTGNLIQGSGGASEDLPLPEVLGRLDQRRQQIKNMQFGFVEHVRGENVPKETIRGEVFFKAPHQLRVEQRTPQKQVLMTDGETVWIYVPALRQQLIADWASWKQQTLFPQLLIDFVGGWTAERHQQYNVLFGGHHDGLYRLNYRPLGGGEVPLTLWISDETFLPVRGHIQYPSVVIDLSFVRVEVNQPLSHSVFEASVPHGTEIIDTRP